MVTLLMIHVTWVLGMVMIRGMGDPYHRDPFRGSTIPKTIDADIPRKASTNLELSPYGTVRYLDGVPHTPIYHMVPVG